MRGAPNWMPRQMTGARSNARGMTPRTFGTATNCLRALQSRTGPAYRNSKEGATIQKPTRTSLSTPRLIDNHRRGRVRSRIRKHNLKAKTYGTLWHRSEKRTYQRSDISGHAVAAY